jgi:hypothetical protein
MSTLALKGKSLKHRIPIRTFHTSKEGGNPPNVKLRFTPPPAPAVFSGAAHSRLCTNPRQSSFFLIS